MEQLDRQEISTLENNSCEIVGEHKIYVQRQRFDIGNFLQNPSVGYLEKCNLDQDRDAMDSLLNIWSKLDFPCGKYLIGHWINELYNWEDYFLDNIVRNRKMLIHFICRYGCTQSIEHILNIYIEKKLDLGCKTDNGWTPFTLLFRHCLTDTINRVLDICIGKNLHLKYKTANKLTPLMLVCFCGCEQVIQHMINLYVDRDYDLDEKSKRGKNFLNIVCEFRHGSIIKFVIDVCVEKNLSFCYRDIRPVTIEQSLNANEHLKNRVMHMYLNCLETDVFVSA